MIILQIGCKRLLEIHVGNFFYTHLYQKEYVAWNLAEMDFLKINQNNINFIKYKLEYKINIVKKLQAGT